ncbi:MAG: Rnf-Nqr domain containing protein [Chloroflexota bacterium]
MSNKGLFEIFFQMAIVNNFAVALFLGLCPFFGVTKRVKDAVPMGVALGLVMFISAAICWILTYQLLIPFKILYMNNVIYILVISTLVQLTEMYVKRTNANLYNAFGIFLPLITVNCGVLGITFINLREQYSLIQSIVSAFGGAVGFAYIMIVMAAIREKLDTALLPINFRGLPIAIFVAMLLGLTFYGFAGLV